MNKMKYIKYLSILVVVLVLQGCISNKNLSNTDIMAKAVGGCPNPDMSIMFIPSRGLVADSLSASLVKKTHNDGGFAEDFANIVKSGQNNITIYSSSEQKLKAYLEYTLTSFKDNNLQGITVCVVGIPKEQVLSNEAKRTGAKISFVP